MEMPSELEKSFVEIYDDASNIEVRVSEDSVWLSLNQITDLFGRDKSVISRHLKNIFNEGELERNSVVAFFVTNAHLLYFMIKDHPFGYGKKRIGSLLFLLYLKKSGLDVSKMNENTLTAVALLTAESDPKQKNLVVALITHLIG